MIQFLKNLFQRDQSQLPTVPEFLRDGVLVKQGDVLITNQKERYVFELYAPWSPYCQIGTNDLGFHFSGWQAFCHVGEKHKIHIIRIERNGKVVARGQEYT